jgi:Condensation domain
MLQSRAHSSNYSSGDLLQNNTPACLPLSFQQQWLLEVARRYEDWNCTAGYTFRFAGMLDLDLLQRSLEEIVRRHGSLRARIVSIDGVTGQIIDNARSYHLDVVSIHGESREEIGANARRAAEDIYDSRMDVSTGPLWTAKLLRLSDREHWLVLVMHRLIAECSSIERVFLELRSLYDELHGGHLSTFSTTPPQYSDYVVSQQKTRDNWVTGHEAYWSDRLAGASSVCWPVDPDVAVTTRGTLGKVSCAFGSALSLELREFARKLHVLSATVMLAVYAVTLWRWCRQDDLVLPFNVAGRQSEHRPVVGYFSYILYLRVGLAGHETYREFLRRISNEFYRALAHQDFGRIATQKPELLAGTLFQWVTWHPDDAARATTQAPANPLDTVVERVPIREFGEGLTIVPPGMIDTEITMFDASEGICALGTYRADRFTARTMERFMADLRSVAQMFVHDPDARLECL